MQASQSELDLEKFAASILLDDEPLPAPDLGPARASDSSLQGSSSEWEAMLIDNGSVETSNTGGTRDLGTACGMRLAMGFYRDFHQRRCTFWLSQYRGALPAFTAGIPVLQACAGHRSLNKRDPVSIVEASCLQL